MNGIVVDQEQQVPPSGPSNQMAQPLHIQRLEAALDMRPFMQQAREVLSRPLTSPEETEVEDSQAEESFEDEYGVPGTKKKKTKKLGTKQGKHFIG